MVRKLVWVSFAVAVMISGVVYKAAAAVSAGERQARLSDISAKQKELVDYINFCRRNAALALNQCKNETQAEARATVRDFRHAQLRCIRGYEAPCLVASEHAREFYGLIAYELRPIPQARKKRDRNFFREAGRSINKVAVNVGRSTRKFGEVLTKSPECIGPASRPEFMMVVTAMNVLKPKLVSAGITDRTSCKAKRSELASRLEAEYPGTGSGARRAGRCACDMVY